MMDKSVVIVGGGVAGLAAGASLLKAGFDNITVLEAEHRLGGRIHTVPFGSGSVDLGAHWVHGEEGNLAWKAGSERGLLRESTDFEGVQFLTSEGDTLSAEAGQAILEGALNLVDEREALARQHPQTSLAEYLSDRWGEVTAGLGLSDAEIAASLEWASRFEASIEGSDTLEEVSAKGLAEYSTCPGSQLIVWPDGYHDLLPLIADPLLPEGESHHKVRLGAEVVEVNWSGDMVETRCSDGTLLRSDHVIVTIPLAVLKETHHSLFNPPLPSEKVNAIKGLGMGTVNKVFLYYETEWWDPSTGGFSFLHLPTTQDGDDWMREVIGVYRESGKEGLLVGWLVGRAARETELLSEEELSQGFTSLLRTFLRRNVPTPTHVLRSSWYSNPHFRGSYSFRSLSTEENATSAQHLAAPLSNASGKQVLLFGGEATHGKYYSTVHGALESGLREADRIIQLYKKKEREAEVIVVGAGLAGLAAARALVQAGVDTLLIEGGSCVGGRVRSIELGERVGPTGPVGSPGPFWLELGAQWIHGTDNPLYRMAKQNDLISHHLSYEGQGLYLRAGGEEVNWEVVEEVNGMVASMLGECDSIFRSGGGAERGLSVGQLLRERFEEHLSSTHHTPHTLAIKRELLDWHLRFQVIDNSCSDLEKLSAWWWGEYESGPDNINLREGYSSLVKLLLNDLPPNTLILDSPVSTIHWSPEGADCRVDCETGEKYKASHVIVTCSIGVLKGEPALFSPPLPPMYRKALDAIGFDVIDKIYVVYEEAWWEAGVEGFQILWPVDHTLQLEEGEGRWLRGLSGFDVCEKGVLLGWLGGENAILMEDLPLPTIAGQLTLLFAAFTNRTDVPPPARVVRSRWGRERLVRGGYSHVTTEAGHLDVHATLSTPILINNNTQPGVVLAGEGCSRKHYSTSHGALESGLEQAQLILDFIRPSASTTEL